MGDGLSGVCCNGNGGKEEGRGGKERKGKESWRALVCSLGRIRFWCLELYCLRGFLGGFEWRYPLVSNDCHNESLAILSSLPCMSSSRRSCVSRIQQARRSAFRFPITKLLAQPKNFNVGVRIISTSPSPSQNLNRKDPGPVRNTELTYHQQPFNQSIHLRRRDCQNPNTQTIHHHVHYPRWRRDHHPFSRRKRHNHLFDRGVHKLMESRKHNNDRPCHGGCRAVDPHTRLHGLLPHSARQEGSEAKRQGGCGGSSGDEIRDGRFISSNISVSSSLSPTTSCPTVSGIATTSIITITTTI